MPYDPEADARLKEIGDQLVKHLEDHFLRRNPIETWKAFDGATTLAKKAIGFLPIGDRVNKMSDEEIVAADSRAEAILAIIALCEGLEKPFRKRDLF
jgi:hypothetical protein